MVAMDAGCGKGRDPAQLPGPGAPAAAVPAAWPATRQTDRGNFGVTIRPEGGSITRNRHFSLEVVLKPGSGAGAPDGVLVDADMPAHRHGMNTKPEIVHEGGQSYRVNGMLFHMAGEWSITVVISVGKTEERAAFPVLVE
jgi:hypothetical protein